MEINKPLKLSSFINKLLSINDAETSESSEKPIWREIDKSDTSIEDTRFILNSVQDVIYYSKKFRYFTLNDEYLTKLTAGRNLCLSTVRKKIKTQVKLTPEYFNLRVNLVICYSGICFLIYDIEAKKETPIDVVLNLNYLFPKTDEQNYVNVYLEKIKQNGKDFITFDRQIPDKVKEKENIINENILTEMVLGEIRHYIMRDNTDHRLYDRPIVYSYAVICDDKQVAPNTELGKGFDAKHRYLRGLSAVMEHRKTEDFDTKQFDTVYIDEGSLISFQMDFVCVWVSGWNEYNRTGLTMKLRYVYFNIFLLALSQFYTLNYLSFYHTKARERGRIRSIQRFLTSLRRYKIDLMFDVVSMNTNLKNFYEKLMETYHIKELKESIDNNLSVDEANILSKKESVMNFLLALLTFVGIPLGIFTEMFDSLMSVVSNGITNDTLIPFITFISAIILDIGLIIMFFLRKDKIKT